MYSARSVECRGAEARGRQGLSRQLGGREIEPRQRCRSGATHPAADLRAELRPHGLERGGERAADDDIARRDQIERMREQPRRSDWC